MLNRKIAIQQLVGTKTDAKGNSKPNWQPYCMVYAYINGLSGSEYWSACAVQAENTVVFTVRYSKMLKDITPQKYNILLDGVIYDIQHIDNVQFGNHTIKIKGVAKIG